MSWQDLVFTVGTLVLVGAVFRMVLHVEKPPLISSLSTFAVLTAFAVAYSSLHLTFATITTALSAALWLTLAVQKVRTNE